ncbi:MAG: ABC transporter ATP-binding protein [Lachnospiraceae bacterium]|nr:ABC transporter ATP-binding protein [Lachnospiraceae bacterium]
MKRKGKAMWYSIKILRKCSNYMFVITALCLLSPFFAIATSSTMGTLTEYFSRSGLPGSGRLITAIILFYLLEECLEYLFLAACGRLQSHAYSAMQRNSFDQLTHLSMDHALMASPGDLYNRVANDTNEVTLFLSDTLPSVLKETTALFITLTYLFRVNWSVTLLYLIAVICSIAVQAMISRIMEQAGKEAKACEVEMNTRLGDALGGRMIVKTYGAYDFADYIYQESSFRLAKARIRLSCLSMPLKIAGILCGMIPILSVCLAGLYLIPNGRLNMGAFLSMFYLCQKIMPNQLHYVDLLIDGVKVKPAAARLEELWQAADGPKQAQSKTASPSSAHRPEAIDQNPAVVMEHVWYRYPGEEAWAVWDVTLTIPAGKKIAFIGESGCGKSTVLKLIGGLIFPEKGRVCTAPSVCIGQFPYLFSGSIKDNIVCGRSDGEEEDPAELERACRCAEIPSFLHRMEHGIHTPLLENGGNLSGGQRQRIAVARALYSQASVLLFDESVSALDADTSRRMIENILREKTDQTVIMVLHQKELLPLFDQIYVFGSGRLTDPQCHEEECHEAG